MAGKPINDGQGAARPKNSMKRTTNANATEAVSGKSLEWRKQQEILKLFGTVEYDEKYDYETKREQKR